MTEQRGMVPTRPAPASVMTFGSQQLDAADFIPPRVKILQPMSAETGGDVGGNNGDFYNTLTGENYGPKLRVVPIIPLKQRVLLVRDNKRTLVDTLLAGADLAPLPEGDGLACRSIDMVRGIGHPGDELWRRTNAQGYNAGCPECPLALWRGKEPPPCSETYNVVAVTDTGDLVILSFAKSSAKTGKKFFTLMTLTGSSDAKPWAYAYEVTTSEQRNAQGKFWTAQVTRLSDRPSSELMREAANWYPRFSGRVVDVTGEAAGEVAEDPDEAGRDDTMSLDDAQAAAAY